MVTINFKWKNLPSFEKKKLKSTCVLYNVATVINLFFSDRCKQTVGGSAQGACCNFPFIYKGAVYWTCTTKDSVKHWCSTTKVFDIEKKWGFCV